jgi:Zn-dependent protease with chaperone function
MYGALGICLSLAGWMTFNAAGALLAAFLWRLLAPATRSWTPSSRARLIFGIRLTPGIAAILLVGIFCVPAYLAHEPRNSGEIVSYKMFVLAALPALVAVVAILRGLATWACTRGLLKSWLREAEPIQLRNAGIPTYRFGHPLPVLAIVGAIRPRLFIAGQIFDSLTAPEIEAAVAHENGHLRAHDNWKRGFLNAYRDALQLFPSGRALDQAWLEASEMAADESAARGGQALDLASALVKIARLVPRAAGPLLPAGVSRVIQERGQIGSRVLRLAEFGAGGIHGEPGFPPGVKALASTCLLGILAALILSAAQDGFLASVHATLESVVTALQ